jgi:hypothetical protein
VAKAVAAVPSYVAQDKERRRKKGNEEKERGEGGGSSSSSSSKAAALEAMQIGPVPDLMMITHRASQRNRTPSAKLVDFVASGDGRAQVVQPEPAQLGLGRHHRSKGRESEEEEDSDEADFTPPVPPRFRSTVADVPLAPVFYPTAEELSDPIALLRLISAGGCKAGIAVIVPPPFQGEQEAGSSQTTEKSRAASDEGGECINGSRPKAKGSCGGEKEEGRKSALDSCQPKAAPAAASATTAAAAPSQSVGTGDVQSALHKWDRPPLPIAWDGQPYESYRQVVHRLQSGNDFSQGAVSIN